MQEHARTRKRLAALAAFGAFWAALLVTIGFPLWFVAVGYVALVVGLAAAFEGGHALSAVVPRARRVDHAVAGRVAAIDWSPLRKAGSGAVATTRRAAAAAGVRATALRRQAAEAGSRRSARSEAQRLNARAATMRQRGALDAALEASEKALALVRGLGDRHAEALTLNGLGLTQARLGDEAAAVDSYETAVAILTELGDGHGAGRVLANLGALQLDLGHPDEARARWTDALERLEPGSPEHERTAERLRLASD